MEIKLRLTQALSIAGASLILTTGAFANQLINGGFELNPPASGFGNHIGHPITPWVLGTGDDSNVIRTNQGINSTGDGPRSDASGTASGTIRHYLDIANGKNDFYQTFTSSCTGEATFGGYFSTRNNSGGNAAVTLRNGTGFSGSIVGQSNPVTLPGGISSTDPWTLVSYTGQVQAGNTYSLVIAMDNSMNFDEAFVNIKGCAGDGGTGPIIGGEVFEDTVPSFPNIPVIVLPAPVDNCCPPINEQSIARQLTPVFQPGGGSNAKYRLNFSATSQFNNQNQNYLNYVNSMQPPINALISTWRVFDHGPGGIASTPPSTPSVMIEEFFTTFHITNPVNHGNTSSSYTMKPNNWYRVQVGTYFNDGNKFFPQTCGSSSYYVNWQVGNKSSGSAGHFIISNGKKELVRIKSEPKANTTPMKAVPIKRGATLKRF
ncbi:MULTISPECIES: hypothetical protein [unclassified Psychrobacter]|uniref:hypothetical protein n=1 Tax=unclassified Psychrobacter TaxID=196806 RepID=UPI0025B342C0|nr:MULTISPECIES: hypothetical protein [unclassified Psychrobacter]MDN3452776.1 hypothetical protein [Psychrobacter sp. APC 3350]MDN3502683.1 hypothetical protein [Psychrobacter sp. 5A.1]